jgi:tetratricopeptide (TPR) repeat protein
MKIHPHDLLLLELADGPGPLPAAGPAPASAGLPSRLGAHLAACRTCRDRLRALAADRPSGRALAGRLSERLGFAPRSVDYGPALARTERLFEVWRATFARERAEAPGLLAELLAQPPERRRLLLDNSRRFQSWGLCDLLLAPGGGGSEEAEERGRLALRLAGVLDSARYGAQRLEDLRARAWAQIGEARRLCGDLQAAARAFEDGAAHLRAGTGELLERATFLELRAALRLDQGRPAEAARLLQRALAIHRELGDIRRIGGCLVRLAETCEQDGRPAAAVALWEEAADCLEGTTDPLLLAALHGLLLSLLRQGRLLPAQRLLIRLRRLSRHSRAGLPPGVGPKSA